MSIRRRGTTRTTTASAASTTATTRSFHSGGGPNLAEADTTVTGCSIEQQSLSLVYTDRGTQESVNVSTHDSNSIHAQVLGVDHKSLTVTHRFFLANCDDIRNCTVTLETTPGRK
jgi:hypothetical protein